MVRFLSLKLKTLTVKAFSRGRTWRWISSPAVEVAPLVEAVAGSGTRPSPPAGPPRSSDRGACRRSPGAGRSRRTTTGSGSARCPCSAKRAVDRHVAAEIGVVQGDRAGPERCRPWGSTSARSPSSRRSCRAGRTCSRAASGGGCPRRTIMSCISMSTLGYFAWTRWARSRFGADVVLHAIGHGVAVGGVQAAAVPPVAVEHQEGHAVGAIGQQPLLRGGQVLLRSQAEHRPLGVLFLGVRRRAAGLGRIGVQALGPNSGIRPSPRSETQVASGQCSETFSPYFDRISSTNCRRGPSHFSPHRNDPKLVSQPGSRYSASQW